MAKFGLPGGGKRTSQPQYPVRPSRKALELGLTSLQYAGVQVYPVPSSLSFVNGASLSPGLKGRSIELDGTNDYAVNRAAFPLHNNYNFTVLTRFRSDFASSSATRRGLWHFTNTVGSAAARIRMIWLNATDGFYLDTNAGFAFKYKPTINAGEIHTLGYSRNGLTGVANNPFFWDGVQVTSIAVSNGANAGAPTSALLYSGFDTENAAWVWDGSIEYIATFNKALSAKDVRDISNNPYGELLEPLSRNIYVEAAGGGVTAALTGQGITVAQGSLSAAVESALSGQAVSLAQGTVTVESGVTAALTGQGLSLAQGSVSPVVSAALSGQSTTLTQGSVVADVSQAITGQAVSLAQDSVTAAIAAPLTGQSLTLVTGDIAIGGDIVRALTGQSITIAQGSLDVGVSGQGDGKRGSGWERFKDLKPLKRRLQKKQIPEEVIEVIEEIILETDIQSPVKNPVSVLRKELHSQEISYSPVYGEILKIELKLAIQQQQQMVYEQEEEELLLLMAA